MSKNLTEELEALRRAVETRSGLPSRWNGQVLVVDDIIFRWEFPAELEAEREGVFETIRNCLAEGTREAVGQAAQAQTAWLERYPDDYAMWDMGEPIAMLADALEITAQEGEPHNAPVAVSRAA